MVILFGLLIVPTWLVGVISWVVYLSYKTKDWDLIQEEKSMEIYVSKFQLSRAGINFEGFTPPTPTPVVEKEIPQAIKELMTSSPSHPEVAEIDGNDRILGVRFEAEDYPPEFAQDDEHD